jgi:F0F1-type ATP synthase membrane subunit b/b'
MDINVTFFVQAFHFLIAYSILEKLLFKPTVKTIQQEQKQYNDLITTINAQQKLLKDKEELKQQEWRNVKTIFAEMIPHVTTHKKFALRSRIGKSEIQITQQEQQDYEQSLQKVILKRLRHVS